MPRGIVNGLRFGKRQKGRNLPEQPVCMLAKQMFVLEFDAQYIYK